jgi:hypothetical protein
VPGIVLKVSVANQFALPALPLSIAAQLAKLSTQQRIMLNALALRAQSMNVACHCAVLLARALALLTAHSSLILVACVADLLPALLTSAVLEHVCHRIFDADKHKHKFLTTTQKHVPRQLETNLEFVPNLIVA